MANNPNIPDISEVDFDIRLKVLLGLPPVREEEEDGATSSPIEPDLDT